MKNLCYLYHIYDKTTGIAVARGAIEWSSFESIKVFRRF